MYNFNPTHNQIEYTEKIKPALALFESLLDYCFDEAYQKAQDTKSKSGILQTCRDKVDEKATKAVVGTLVKKGVEVPTGSEAYGQIAEAVASTGMHFLFMYKNQKEKKNLERAKKLLEHIKIWGGIESIKKIVINYLTERFNIFQQFIV